ncbi:fructosamine kinase family protein [Streptomyces sp. NPDC059740]|uniref:fructosamine kinase family protein n=1 Tax=Streptomyces sp. NPDC059740 TaxID=3346926 RepID=UPI0036662752
MTAAGDGALQGDADAAGRLTGRPVTAVRPTGAGLTRLELEGVGAVLVKRGSGPGAAPAEAAGLRWLAEAEAVPVPRVHGADADRLVIDVVSEGRPSPDAARELGRSLAALHAAGAPAFGSPPPGGPVEAWIGDAPMRNETGPTWAPWYAEHRVLPYLRRAVDLGVLSGEGVGVLEQVCEALPGLAGPEEAPARLHGDLWNGNVLWGGDGRAWLIDPAAHGGHRESDLAMLALFGCPHLDLVLDGYQAARPLAGGWRQRVGLHQLFPLLVHTVLFGGGYGEQAVAAARAALHG